MKNMTALGVVLASALALTACGGNKSSSNTKTASNTAAPAAAAPAASNTSNAAAPAASGAATADATNQNFTIRNHTGHAIRELYVSAVSSNNWEEDVLGRDTLADGEALQVQFERAETQCNWDLKVVLDNDQSMEERNVNLCQTAEIEVAP